MNDLNYGRVATIIGRYYAMDRDKRWERIKIAFEALTQGVGEKSQNPLSVSILLSLNIIGTVLDVNDYIFIDNP
jgi:bisphosphoglycerate-independent phosphoglycerate mutase (AlkP superfamily)